MKSNPKISVIIPTYNREQMIKEAIESVLSQTYKDFEIIVVDDGSTDNTKKVLGPYKDKIKYLRRENKGAAAARNTGIKHARGKYIGFLDSDDLWRPTKLEKQVEILDKYKDISVVYSNFIKIDENNRIINTSDIKKYFPSGYIFREILLRKATCFLVQTLLMRKKCFEEIGYFDTELKKGHDRDMIVRLARKYRFYGIKRNLFMFRIHNLTSRLSAWNTKIIEYYDFKFLDKLFKIQGSNLDRKIKKKLFSIYYFRAGLGYIRKEKDLFLARKRFLLAILNNPFKLRAYIYFFSTLVGIKGLNFIRFVKRVIFLPLFHFCRSNYTDHTR